MMGPRRRGIRGSTTPRSRRSARARYTVASPIRTPRAASVAWICWAVASFGSSASAPSTASRCSVGLMPRRASAFRVSSCSGAMAFVGYRLVRTRIILILLGWALLASGCGSSAASSGGGRTRVVAAFYPLAYAAEQIGGRTVSVENLTPAGAEPHDLELSPRSVADVQSADLVLLLGQGFQKQVESAAGHGKHVLLLLDTSGLRRFPNGDPHVWLDPKRYELIARRIGAALHRPAATKAFVRKLAALDREYARGLAHCERRGIITSHQAFAYLAQRYHLSQVAIAGPNGGGKTTLLRLILGLERPQQGSVRLLGEAPERLTKRSRIAYLAQRAQLGIEAPATVREVVTAGRTIARGPFRLLGAADRAVVDEAIGRVGLTPLTTRPLSRLSGGQQQRAFIAKALAGEPEVLVLDEPTAGVDVEAQAALAELLEKLHDELGTTVLYVSHEFGAVEPYVDRLVLVSGTIVFDGPPSGLQAPWHA